jgi:uncharacterized membrane protein YfcA
METQIGLFLVAIVIRQPAAVGLLTFPVLMTVLPPVTADATSAVAHLPAYMTSTWAGRKHLPPVRHWFWLLLGPSLLGSLIGALLLNWSGNRSFTALIRWLILTATLLTLRPLLTRTAHSAHSCGPVAPGEITAARSVSLQIGAGVLLFFVAIYGGYFGAGIGILVIAAFDLIGLTDIHSILPLKNALCGSLPGRCSDSVPYRRKGELEVRLGDGRRRVAWRLSGRKCGALDESDAGSHRYRHSWLWHSGILLLKDIRRWDSSSWERLN